MTEILRLRSGRELRANRGLIGINDRLEVAEGYDGDLLPTEFEIDEGLKTTLSLEERTELALTMIHRWVAWVFHGHDVSRL